MFTLKVNTDSAAFDGDQTYEVARILRIIADNIEGCGDDASDSYSEVGIRDINGNTVGHWKLDARETADE